MTLKIKNFAASTLASDLAVGATSIAVAAGEGSRFPSLSSGEWFPLVLISASSAPTPEIVRVTAVAGDTLTVEREQEGTTAVALNTGDIISHRMTEAAFAEFLRSGDALKSGFAVAGGTANALTATVAAVAEYTDGVAIRVRALSTNTNANVTVNVNGLGPINITRFGSQALLAGSIQAGSVLDLTYDDGENAFVISNAYPIEHTNPTIPAASDTVAGVARRRALANATFNESGEDTRFVTEASASKIAAEAVTNSPENTLPFIWRNRGGLTVFNKAVLNGETFNVDSFKENHFNDLTVNAGGLLQAVGGGVAVLRCEGTFKLTGRLKHAGSIEARYPLEVVGPRSGGTPVIGGSTELFPAQAQPGKPADTVKQQLSVREFRYAIEAGMPLTLFHGGGPARYTENSPSVNFAGVINRLAPTAPGIIVIAKNVEIDAGASVEGLHGYVRNNFGSGDARHGPASGGMLCLVGETVSVDATVDYEIGLEAGTVNSDAVASSGLQDAAYWLAEAALDSSDETGMANGQVFTIVAPIGQQPTYARIC